MKDLNMKNHIWVPIGGHILESVSTNGKYYKIDSTKITNIFRGNFDGNNKTISGLYYNCSEEGFGEYVGVFGIVRGYSPNSRIEIKNLNVVDSYLNGRNYVGNVGGLSLNVSVTNCVCDGMLIGTERIGGILGDNAGGETINCEFYGKINVCGKYVLAAGISGYGGNKIINCISDCSISVKVSTNWQVHVGGIAGVLGGDSIVTNNIVYGNYEKTNDSKDTVIIGGIVGSIQSGVLEFENNMVDAILKGHQVGGILGIAQKGTQGSKISYGYWRKDNNILSGVGVANDAWNPFMLASFESLTSNASENYIYMDATSEQEGYEGSLLTKLNKYVENHQSENLLSWKIDEETQKLTFDK